MSARGAGKIGALILALAALGVPRASAQRSEAAWQEFQPSPDSFFRKAGFLLKQKEQLGLTEEQVRSIRDLNTETKKNLIRGGAEIEIFELDIFTKLHDEGADPAEVQKLIEQKFDTQKKLSQNVADAYFRLKGTLDDRQQQTLNDLGKKWLDETEKRDKGTGL
ncbi:MAG TPA: Spy/CpxP family protein refolding chaperone [Verrucomicrobiae bacterium]|jgi:hypothetical protein|nr:Spy/CpxP family protein refolding chaperone [Verrucomicrobiae bacterium]